MFPAVKEITICAKCRHIRWGKVLMPTHCLSLKVREAHGDIDPVTGNFLETFIKCREINKGNCLNFESRG